MSHLAVSPKRRRAERFQSGGEQALRSVRMTTQLFTPPVHTYVASLKECQRELLTFDRSGSVELFLRGGRGQVTAGRTLLHPHPRPVWSEFNIGYRTVEVKIY